MMVQWQSPMTSLLERWMRRQQGMAAPLAPSGPAPPVAGMPPRDGGAGPGGPSGLPPPPPPGGWPVVSIHQPLEPPEPPIGWPVKPDGGGGLRDRLGRRGRPEQAPQRPAPAYALNIAGVGQSVPWGFQGAPGGLLNRLQAAPQAPNMAPRRARLQTLLGTSPVTTAIRSRMGV